MPLRGQLAGGEAPPGARVIARFEEDGAPAGWVEADGTVHWAFDAAAARRALLAERGRRLATPAAARLPFHYHRVPAPLRFAIARGLGAAAGARGRAATCAPPLAPVDLLDRAAARAAGEAEPSRAPIAVALTHDLDTRAGLRHVPALAAMAERRGARATFFVCAKVLGAAGAPALLRDLAARRHEIACHGDDHDVRAPLVPARLRADLARARAAFVAAGLAPPRGYRAPAFTRTPWSSRIVATAGFTWESSIPAAEAPSVRPFRRGRLVSMPVTLPADHDVLFAGLGAAAALSAWRAALDRVGQLGGIAVLLIHPEPHLGGGHRPLRRAYGKLLDELEARDDVAGLGTLGAALGLSSIRS